MKELRYLNHYFVKYRGRLLIGLLITVVARLFALIVPMKVGDIVNVVEQRLNAEITVEQMESLLLNSILLIIGATLLSAFFLRL
jgi:ATP-binding cassette subfamily B protein